VENKKCFDIVDARYKHEDYIVTIFMYRQLSKKEIIIKDTGLKKNQWITVELKFCFITLGE
jgi:hypothetical protein